MTDQVVTSHTSVTTSPGTVNLKDTGSGTGSSHNVQYRADQLSMCHGFTPPGHVAELIFQASRLNSAAGPVAYHGIQAPMTVGPLGNLRTYQRPNEALNTPSLVQIGSGGVIGLSPSMAHQNMDHTVHGAGTPAVLGHVTDGSNQVMHMAPLTGRLVGTQNTIVQGIDNAVQDLSNTPGFQNVSADAGLNKVSDPSSGIVVAADHTNTAVNYSSMPAVSDSGPKGSMALSSNMFKAGISMIPSTGFSTALYPNLIVSESVAKGNIVTSSINSNYSNLTYLGLTLANSNAGGQSPLLVATGGTNPVAAGSCVQQSLAGIDMTATSSQANDLSKTAVSTVESTTAATGTKTSTTTSAVPIISTAGHVQCTTLDALASGAAILGAEDSALSVCLMQGLPDARNADQLSKALAPEVIAGKVKIQSQSSTPDCPGSPPLVSTEDACQCLMTAIVYMEQHPSLATDHADMLRKILQHVIEDDHNTNMAKCTAGTVKLEGGIEEGQSSVKVNGGSCNVTQWVVANPYRCKHCGKRFPQYSVLSEHMVIHSNGSLWQCTACDKTFADEDGLNVHKKLDCDSFHRCDVCGKGFIQSNNLERHMNSHTDVKSHSCNVCGKCFSELNSVKKHMTVHSGEKPFECPTCSRRFAQLCNLQTHAQFHSKDKPHACPICNKCYAHSSDLRRHCLRIHGCRDPSSVLTCIERAALPASFLAYFGRRKKSRSNTGRYQCTTCEKRFQRAKDLQRHCRIHTGEKPYTCNTCGKKFSDQSAIRVHNLIHTGERPHKCTICGKGFRQSSTLHTHMRLHSGERPFLCTLCGKSFATPGYLTHHMKYHGEKTFRCGVCGQGFVTTVDLQRHTVVHTGEKPYKCNICGKGFGWERNLKTHMKTHNVGQ